MKRYAAPAVTAAGAIVIFAGLLMLSPVAAFIILAGVLLMALGLLAIEVPMP